MVSQVISPRGSGRTTRMLQNVVEASLVEDVIVVAASRGEAKNIESMLNNMGANMRNVRVRTIYDNLRGMQGHMFWDHFAIEEHIKMGNME